MNKMILEQTKQKKLKNIYKIKWGKKSLFLLCFPSCHRFSVENGEHSGKFTQSCDFEEVC